MWIDHTDGSIYNGDCRLGDRAATSAEITAWTTKKAQAALPGQAQDALTKSGITIDRCVENGVTVPPAWVTYRKALRNIVNGSDTTSTVLPTVPAWPSGT